MEINVRQKVRVPGERETRDHFLNLARQQGVEDQLIKIFDRYDSAVKSARSEVERHQMAAQGAAEVYRLLGIINPLIVDGKQILPGQPGWEEAMRQYNKLQKLD